jgi:hypothetical protein
MLLAITSIQGFVESDPGPKTEDNLIQNDACIAL